MITLRLNAFSDDEITDLINRLNVINPKTTKRCEFSNCSLCDVRHVCYAIDRAAEYAQAYLDGRSEK